MFSNITVRWLPKIMKCLAIFASLVVLQVMVIISSEQPTYCYNPECFLECLEVQSVEWFIICCHNENTLTDSTF